MRLYQLTEIVYSIQGEGVRAGTPAVFVRFAGCNLRCTKAEVGFDCDTDFPVLMTINAMEMERRMREELPQGILEQAQDETPRNECWCILTGGEPALQASDILTRYLWEQGWKIGMETNGTHLVDNLDLDWLTVSPKVSGSTLIQRTANEVKYVLAADDDVPPELEVKADHYLISPAWEMSVSGPYLPRENLEHCIELVKSNPSFRLSVQQHHGWRVR